MLNWLRNYVGVKQDTAVQSALERLVRFDPAGASEADLRTMDQNLDALGRQVAQARVEFDREHKEADEYRARYSKRLAAVQLLKDQVDAEQDEAKKAGLRDSLSKFVAETADLKSQVQMEVQDETQAHDLLDQLSQAYEAAAAKLRQARQDLERAGRDVRSADQRKQAAEQRAEAAKVANGLSHANDGVSIALDALHKAAEKSRAEATVLDDKARLLKPTDLVKEDPNIAAAMRKAETGGKPAPSLDDEIASLAL